MVLKALMKLENMILTVEHQAFAADRGRLHRPRFIRELRAPRVQRRLSKNHSEVFIISDIVAIGGDLQGLE